VVAGDAVIDVRRRLPGRGAHLHPDPDCLALALRRRALPRALRHAELDCTHLSDEFTQSHQIGQRSFDPSTEGG